MQTTILAALANMSSHFADMHTVAAQKFMTLFDGVLKRYTKMSRDPPPTPPPFDDVSGGVTRPELAVIQDMLRLLLEIFNAILCRGLAVRAFFGLLFPFLDIFSFYGQY